MKKADLLTAVQGKKGFHSIVEDKLAPDNIQGDPIEKRFLYVNHLNTDGTMGKTFIYYLYDTATDDAWFYNKENESVDTGEPNSEQKKLNALMNYLASNFNAYFVERYDLNNNWAEADVYTLSAGKLQKKKVLVFKQGANPISHLDVVTV